MSDLCELATLLYQRHRETMGVRAAIRKVAEETGCEAAEVARALGLERFYGAAA